MRWDSLIHNYTYQQQGDGTPQGPSGKKVPFERTREEFVSVRFAIADVLEDIAAEAFTKGDRRALGKTFAIPIDRLARSIEKNIDLANQQNKIFLSLNKTLPQVFAENSKQLNAMPGDLESKLTTLFAFQREGFTNVGAATASLAGRMKITGQNIQGLIEANKTLLIRGRLQQSQIDKFNKNLANLSIRYQVSTEKLLEGMSELNTSLGVLSLAGTLGGTQTAIKGLTAQFPILSKDIGTFTDQFVTADVGQLGILGGLNNLGRITSGQINSAEDLRGIIAQTAARARTFAENFKNAGPFAQRAIKNIIGDLGVLAIQLDDALSNTANKLSETDKLFSDLGITLKTALEPFARGIADATIEVGKFVTRIGKMLPEVSPQAKGDLAASFVGGGLLAKFILPKAIGKGMVAGLAKIGIGAVFAKIIIIAAAVASILGAIKLIKLSNENAEDSARKTAENTAALVEIERKKTRDPFGTSRFERLANKALQDNIFRVALSEAVSTKAITQGFATQAELLQTLVDQGLIPDPLTVR